MGIEAVFEAISNAFNSILNPIFSPLLKIPNLLAIIIISFVISLIMVLIYKAMTNQTLMKELKDEIKSLQNKMKEVRDKPDEMMRINKRAMDANMKYMLHSLKPTLVTFIPILIIFAWFNTHMAYYPLVQDQAFEAQLLFKEGVADVVTFSETADMIAVNGYNQTIESNKAKFILNGTKGEYVLKFQVGNQSYEKQIIITESKEDRVYKQPIQTYAGSLKRITINNEKIFAFKDIPVLQSIPWVNTFGWLGSYILFSLIFSLGLRKVLKVY